MPAIFYLSYVALWLVVVFQTLVLIGLTRAIHRPRASFDDLMRTLTQQRPPPETTPSPTDRETPHISKERDHVN